MAGTSSVPAKRRPRDRLAAQIPHAAASRQVTVGRYSWHLQRFGESGPRLLLIHGTGASVHSWRDLVPLLAPRFRVLAFDLPNHGRSKAPRGFRPSLETMGQGIDDLLRAEDFAPDLVVGHSAGAAIAVSMTLSGQIAPRGIVSLNGALLPFRGAAAQVFPALAKLLFLNPVVPLLFSWRAGDSRAVSALLRDTGSRLSEEGKAHYSRLFRDPGHVEGALSMMAHWNLQGLKDALPGLSVPLHLVVGDRDRAIPPSSAAQVAALVPGAQIHHLPDLGHLAHEEDPGAAADLIDRVWSDLERETA